MLTSKTLDIVWSGLQSLVEDRTRTGLMVLGVVVGVATTMLVATMIEGFQTALSSEFEAAGPRDFSIWRFDPDEISSGSWADLWGDNPPITIAEARDVAAGAGVGRASTYAYADGASVRHGSAEVAGVLVEGVDDGWTGFRTGEIVEGRAFLPVEIRRAARIVVLGEALARDLDARVGAEVRVGDERVRVVGVMAPRPDPFGDAPRPTLWAPVTTALDHLGADPNFVRITASPADDATTDRAVQGATAALQRARGERGGGPPSFVVQTNEEVAATQASWLGAASLVLLLLSSIGLGVAGVGVSGMMVILVTERTREIGVRKALGARSRDILVQFLVESTAVTVGGGLVGIVVGTAGAFVLGALTPLPAVLPIRAAVLALAVLTASGVAFGLYPAVRASRLDPATSLRHE